MDEFFDIPTVIVIVIAIVVLFRLRSVLGTRTGNERSPLQRAQQNQPKPANDEKPTPLLPRAAAPAPTAPIDIDKRAIKLEAEIDQLSHGDGHVATGLKAIVDADPAFSPKSFLEGAKQAYEMIVTAFAAGDRKTLKPLLEKDVYDGFEKAIADREAALNAMIGALEAARSEAVKANEAKSHFLANMSHELRTPLNAIVGFGDMLHQEILGPLGVARYREYAADICASGQRLLALVSQMLDLADVEARRLTIERKRLSPGDLLYQTIAAISAMAEKAKVRLNIADDWNSLPDIEGDLMKLRQAFISVLHNAVKFTPAGGEVRVLACRDASGIVVSISDTGVGMTEADIEVVTRPFHRLRSALDGQHQGAGLGLPFAKAIVDLHGGTLTIRSAPKTGTSIEIRLPASQASMSEAA